MPHSPNHLGDFKNEPPTKTEHSPVRRRSRSRSRSCSRSRSRSRPCSPSFEPRNRNHKNYQNDRNDHNDPNTHDDERSPHAEDEKLFIGGLSWDTTDEALRDFFSKYGTVKSATVMRDKRTGNSRGFAFVSFSKAEETEAALAEQGAGKNGRKLDGRVVVARSVKNQCLIDVANKIATTA